MVLDMDVKFPGHISAIGAPYLDNPHMIDY